jgi:hypothetical protein
MRKPGTCRSSTLGAFALLAAAAITVSACGSSSDQQAAPPVITVPIASQNQPPSPPGTTTLAFFDSDAFDTSLAGALSKSQDVRITFAGTTSVNAMPPRVNAWLAEVKKSDGQVVAKDPADTTGSRGLFGLGMIADLIDLVTWYNERKEREAQLATVNDFNATVNYDSKTGSLRDLVFERRPAPPAAAAKPASTP